MKVILLKNVPKVGSKYDVKNVADGFALNHLIPNKLAEIANQGNIKKIETLKAKDTENKKKIEGDLVKTLGGVSKVEITIKGKANEKGHLFAGINSEMISEELKKQANLDIAPEFIKIEKHVKEVGDHDIEVKVLDKSAKFKLTVAAE